MVEDRITDGKRIAQLLASELTGLSTESLDRYGVENADRDAEPSSGGTFAYDVVRDGEPVGSVFVHETSARIDLAVGDESALDAPPVDPDGLAVTTTDDGRVRLHVEYGAAVKRAVDSLLAALEEQ